MRTYDLLALQTDCLPESTTALTISTIQNTQGNDRGPIQPVHPSDNTPDSSLVTLTGSDEIDLTNGAHVESALGVLLGTLLIALASTSKHWMSVDYLEAEENRKNTE